MDLSVHLNRGDCARTIFEDAEYFSKRHPYKLMPITFEAVNETIIRIEHNYCRFSPRDMPESHESHNYTPHTEMKDRNYKKRKIKCLTGEAFDVLDTDSERTDDKRANDLIPDSGAGEMSSDSKMEEERISVQPLDLSLPLAQEPKSEPKFSKESRPNLTKAKSETKSGPDIKQFDAHESNKENVTAPPKKIEVTISRPGQKEFYQPCDIFLNDVARISPDLIKNDCYEIDIVDRTHSQGFNTDKFRTYYIISESTWRIFESSKERIILTNDLDIGEPMVMKEKMDKPKYLIFDQYSLAECLAEFCEKKGGCFEYTCVEESKEASPKMQERKKESQVRHPEPALESLDGKIDPGERNVEIVTGEKAKQNKTDIPNDVGEGFHSGEGKPRPEITEINSVNLSEGMKLGGISASENEDPSKVERLETDNGTCDGEPSVESVECVKLEPATEKNGGSAAGTAAENGGPLPGDAGIAAPRVGPVVGGNFGGGKRGRRRKGDSNKISAVTKSRLKVRERVRKGVRNVKNCDVAVSRKTLRSGSGVDGEETKRKLAKGPPGAATNRLPGRRARTANGPLRRAEMGKTPGKNGRDEKVEESFMMTRNRASAGNGKVGAVSESASEGWKRRSDGGLGSGEDGTGSHREESKLRSGKRRCSFFEKGKSDVKERICRGSKTKQEEETVKRKSARLRKKCVSK